MVELWNEYDTSMLCVWMDPLRSDSCFNIKSAQIKK